MKLRYIYFFYKDKNSGILENYFSFTYPFKFSFNQTNLLKKHGNYFKIKTFKALENRIRKLGYAETQYERCTSCSFLFRIDSRDELEYLYHSPQSTCANCREKDKYKEIIKAQEKYISITDPFFAIYNNNTVSSNSQRRKKQYAYPNIDGTLASLSFLELIYLHQICDKLVNNIGKIKLKAFSFFTHAENLSRSFLIGEFTRKKLLYMNGPLSLYQHMLLRSHATSETPIISSQHLEIQRNIKQELTSPYPILYIPQEYTLKEYKNLILGKIQSFVLTENIYIEISSFLKTKRLGEIKFLAKVACYNNKLKLADKNSIDEKFKRLADSLNLHEINGYFSSAAFRTNYKLDFIPDDQRNRLKNVIFNNYIAGNKITSWHEKTLPNNYQKSFIVDFLENFTEMQNDSWLNLQVNDFLKILFVRFKVNKDF